MLTNSPHALNIGKNTAFPLNVNTMRVSGGIPNQYSIESLKEHELPVVGTFVHSYILPDFRYRVRVIGTDEYLFDGKALKLESIGQGYGKRLTFESDDVLENNNFFWSDSNDLGFAFSIQVLFAGEEFQVHDRVDKCIGRFFIKSVNERQQVINISQEESLISVHAKVNFSASLWLYRESCLPASLCEKEITLTGSGIAMVNRLSSTVKLLETDTTHDDILNRLNVQLFTKTNTATEK